VGADLRLGRIAGVEVAASWSLMVIVGLLVWTLGAGVLPAAAPDAPVVATWAVATVSAVAFFACLLAHELSHCVVARSAGMKIDGIILWMFGGMSRLTGDAPDARSELRMAVAGPVTSAGLAIGLIGLAYAVGATAAPDLAVAALTWLGAVNAMLALFNLVPAYPLDGGRVLRAFLWQHSGDKRRATAVAATAGVRLGYGFVAVGALIALSGAALSGVWMALIGWIVLEAARAEKEGVELRSLLEDVRVDDVMTRDPVTVPRDLTVDALIRHHIGQYRCSAFPVVDQDGSAIGLVTLSRLRDVPDDLRDALTAAQVATPVAEVVTASPGEPVVDLVTRLAPGTGRRALVLQDGALVGIITASDLDRALELAALAGPGALTGARSAERAWTT
jgi:Zn-dependent protease/predicted transcriptional regulator